MGGAQDIVESGPHQSEIEIRFGRVDDQRLSGVAQDGRRPVTLDVAELLEVLFNGHGLLGAGGHEDRERDVPPSQLLGDEPLEALERLAHAHHGDLRALAARQMPSSPPHHLLVTEALASDRACAPQRIVPGILERKSELGANYPPTTTAASFVRGDARADSR